MSGKPLVVFVLGGPGAGKGTQCEKIVQVRKSKWYKVNDTKIIIPSQAVVSSVSFDCG